MHTPHKLRDRRQFLAASALGPSLLMTSIGQHDAHKEKGPIAQHAVPLMEAPQVKDFDHAEHMKKMAEGSMDHMHSLETTERDNLILLANFWAAWPGMRLDRIGSYMADDIVWWPPGAAEPIEGKDSVLKTIGEFLAPIKTTQVEVKRVSAIGNLVIHDRIDRFTRSPGEETRHITGFYLLKTHKITEWRDYSAPEG